MEEVIYVLDKMNIEYERVDHPAAPTVKEADKYIEGMEGVGTKTLFMAGKKDKNFYLIIMDANKRLDIKKLSDTVNDRLHFGNEEYLKEKLGLFPGMVSLFGLINNKENDVKVYIDKDLLDEKLITFHPNDNTATFFISTRDMFKFLKELNYEYKLVPL